MAEEPIAIEDWAVVTAGVRRFLGKVMSPLVAGQSALLSPAFEFGAPTQRLADGRTTREAVVAPVDFAVLGVPLHVFVIDFYLCASLEKEDRVTYERFVRQGLEILARARASRSGLVLPAAGGIERSK